MFHYYDTVPSTISLTIDQYTNGGDYALIMGDNSLTFQVTRLESTTNTAVSNQLGFAIAGSFQFNYADSDQFISAWNNLINLSFLHYWIGRIVSYLIMILIMVTLIFILIFSLIFKNVKIMLHYNEMKAAVDKTIDKMNKTTNQLNEHKEKYDKS